MSVKSSAVFAVIAAACLGYAAHSFQAGPPATKDDLIAAIQQLSRPVEEHKALEAMAGTFAINGKAHITADLTLEWKGTETARMILGGRFLEVDVASDPGEQFKVNSKTIFGFDTRTRKYTLWGVDTLGTYSVSAEGDFDSKTKLLTLAGTTREDGKDLRYKYVFALGDEKTRTMEVLFDIPGAGWEKRVEATSVRK